MSKTDDKDPTRIKLALRVLALVESPGYGVTRRIIDAIDRWCGPHTDQHAVKNYALNALLDYAKELIAPE